MTSLTGKPISFWIDSTPKTTYPPLENNISVDVVIIGGGIVGTHAGDLIGEVCLAIEMGADAVDIGKTIHPHPTLGESIGMAAEVAHGSCTDLPPSRK